MKKKKKGLKAFFGKAREGKKKMSEEERSELEQESQEPQEPQEPREEPEAQAPEGEPEKKEEVSDELAKVSAERDEYLELVQRQKAEFANYRRRTEGIRKDAYEEGRRDTIEALLPVVDNLERALSAAAEESPLLEGVQMVLRSMLDTLAHMGVETIDPQGAPFDAQLMNAVLQGTEEEGEPGTVCQVLQKGYKLGERVIRHAMVKVVAG